MSSLVTLDYLLPQGSSIKNYRPSHWTVAVPEEGITLKTASGVLHGVDSYYVDGSLAKLEEDCASMRAAVKGGTIEIRVVGDI